MIFSTPLFKTGFLPHKQLAEKQEITLAGNEQAEAFFWVYSADCFSFLSKNEYDLSHSFVPTDGTGTARVCCRDKHL